MEGLLKLFYPNGTFSIPSLIFSIILVFVVIKAIYEAIKWIIDKLNVYHKAKTTKQEEKEKIEMLEEHDKQQFEEINKLESEINKIIMLLENIKEN
jgi:biopolymer transport protein ExbB/TolQ